MRKQKKQFLAMLALLAVSATMYASVLIGGSCKAVPIPQTAAEVQAFTLDISDAAEVSWESGSIKMIAVKDNDQWHLKDDPSFPLLQSRISDILSEASSLKPVRTLDPAGLQEYGLDDPAAVLNIQEADGTQHTIRIGNRSSVGEEYYLMLEGQEQVILASTKLAEMLAADRMQYVKTESLPAMLAPSEMTVTKRDGESFHMKKPEDPFLYSYTDYYSWFAETGESWKPLSRGEAEDLVNIVKNIKWTACVDTSSDDPGTYGLADPSVTADVSDGSQTITVLFGDKSPDDTYYAALPGSRMVYTVKADDYEDLLTVSYDSLRAEDICHMNWSKVRRMDIEAGDTVRAIGIESLANDPSGRKYRYTEGGKELDYESVNEIKAMIDKMEPAKQVGAEDISSILAQKPVLSVSFYMDASGDQRMDLSFFRYNDMYDLVSFNGETRQLISIYAADAVIRLNDRLSDLKH